MSRRVICTRPEPENLHLIQHLSSAGFDCCHFPILTRQPIHNNRQMIHQDMIDQLTGIIFISTTAVDLFFQQVNHHQLHCHKLTMIGVGPKTCQHIETAGYHALSPTTDGVDDILKLAPFTQDHHEKAPHWLIVQGSKGRKTLHHQLPKLGIQLSVISVYKRTASKQYLTYYRHVVEKYSVSKHKLPADSDVDRTRDFSNHPIDPTTLNHLYSTSISVITSGHALQLFTFVINEIRDIKEIMLLVPSQRVANQAISLGYKHTITTPLDPHGILNTLNDRSLFNSGFS